MTHNWLARARALKKRRRERLLAAVHQKVDKERERNPLPQGQLELDDEYLSKRTHDRRVLREAQQELAPPPQEFRQLELGEER